MVLSEVFDMVFNWLSSTVFSIQLGNNAVNISMLGLLFGGILFFVLFRFIFRILK